MTHHLHLRELENLSQQSLPEPKEIVNEEEISEEILVQNDTINSDLKQDEEEKNGLQLEILEIRYYTGQEGKRTRKRIFLNLKMLLRLTYSFLEAQEGFKCG